MVLWHSGTSTCFVPATVIAAYYIDSSVVVIMTPHHCQCHDLSGIIDINRVILHVEVEVDFDKVIMTLSKWLCRLWCSCGQHWCHQCLHVHKLDSITLHSWFCCCHWELGQNITHIITCWCCPCCCRSNSSCRSYLLLLPPLPSSVQAASADDVAMLKSYWIWRWRHWYGTVIMAQS